MSLSVVFYEKRLKSNNVVKANEKRNLLHYKLVLPIEYIVSCLPIFFLDSVTTLYAADLFFYNVWVF